MISASRHPIAILFAASLGLLAVQAFAQSVTATVSHRTAAVGDMVQYHIQVTDDGSSDVEPPDISVDGLDIRYAGPSTSRRMEFVNGRFSQSNTTTLVYQIVPSAPGAYTIPAVTLNVAGQPLRTQPLAFKVEKSTGAVSDGQNGTIAFAEIDPFKRELYVGEIVPVEINFYLDARVQAELEQMPELTGEGYTKGKADEPRQQQARKDGKDWKVVTFRTLITPSKAGALTLGPANVPFIAEVPRQQQRRRSLDPFDSFFDNSFFNRAERKRFNVQAPAVDLKVRPLPAAGRLADFSGAIGQFTFTASGKPDHVKVGDPITMTLTVTGKGSFARMQAPALVNAGGWHAYPASKNFEPEGKSEIEGTNTFEMPVTPETAHREMPQFQFTYFDPEQGKYVSLKSKPAPLTVEGAPGRTESAPAMAAAPAASSSDEKPAATPPPDAAGSFRGLAYERGSQVREFLPFYRRREFLLAQALPLAALVVLVFMRMARRAPDASREAKWRRERDQLRRDLRARNDASEFYETAARALQMQTAIEAGLPPGSVDAAMIKSHRNLEPDTAACVEEIFNARAELLYAGAGSAPRAVPPADRKRVLAVIDRVLT